MSGFANFRTRQTTTRGGPRRLALVNSVARRRRINRHADTWASLHRRDISCVHIFIARIFVGTLLSIRRHHFQFNLTISLLFSQVLGNDEPDNKVNLILIVIVHGTTPSNTILVPPLIPTSESHGSYPPTAD